MTYRALGARYPPLGGFGGGLAAPGGQVGELRGAPATRLGRRAGHVCRLNREISVWKDTLWIDWVAETLNPPRRKGHATPDADAQCHNRGENKTEYVDGEGGTGEGPFRRKYVMLVIN